MGVTLTDEVVRGLFDFVKAAVLSEGGDGDAWIVVPDFRGLADRFKDDWFTNRRDGADSVSFNHEQESITFTCVGIAQLPKWASTIVRFPYG